MTTKRDLLAQALDELGMAEYVFDASPEELESGRKRLDRIAAQWDGQGIRVGYNLGGGLEDDAGIPDTAENCFAVHLAIGWAPSFGKTVSQDTRNAAARAFNALYLARGTMPKTCMPASMPRGSGQKRAQLERQYFGPNTGEVDGLDSGATEY